MSTHLTTKSPAKPSDAEFAIYIDFKKDKGDPARVFRAAESIISSLQNLDNVLCDTIDSNIKPRMMLEDIETGSIKIWLKHQLESIDDQHLKDLDWRKIIGSYLVQAKYAYIRWSNKDSGSLSELSKEIQKIAEQTDVRHIPAYKKPSLSDLSKSALEIDKSKSYLIEGDTLKFVSKTDEELEFDLSVSWAPEEIRDISVKETISFKNNFMVLVIKKPDYLGNSKWEFKVGARTLSVKIEDEEWLDKFKSREIDVRPGDALKCLVSCDQNFGFEDELIGEDYRIQRVQNVVRNVESQQLEM